MRSAASRKLLVVLALTAICAITAGCGGPSSSKGRSEGPGTATARAGESTASPAGAAEAVAPRASGRIAFSAGIFPRTDIYVVSVNGSGLRRLTSARAAEFDPSWSPDGTEIAFASTRGGRLPAIWVMNEDGSNPRRVGKLDGEYPAWSPDGRRT